MNIKKASDCIEKLDINFGGGAEKKSAAAWLVSRRL